MLTLGCHLSKKGGFLQMAEEAISINANTFQYFTRNPRGGAVAAPDPADIAAFNTYAAQNGISHVCGYAPYDVEPANPAPEKKTFALSVIKEDLATLEEIPGQYYLLRPGSAPGISKDDAIKCLQDVLNETLPVANSTTVLLDTMPGEGTQIGTTFEELALILNGVRQQGKLGVLLDASAVWAAGYDIKNNLDGVLDKFDSKIGLSRLFALHLNDPKEPCGSHVDRHAPIGEGQLGIDALRTLTTNQRLQDKAFYLEEPHATLETYAEDIKRIRSAV